MLSLYKTAKLLFTIYNDVQCIRGKFKIAKIFLYIYLWVIHFSQVWLHYFLLKKKKKERLSLKHVVKLGNLKLYFFFHKDNKEVLDLDISKYCAPQVNISLTLDQQDNKTFQM